MCGAIGCVEEEWRQKVGVKVDCSTTDEES
jgi:hypothetical protein